jgi:heat shock protein HslJ
VRARPRPGSLAEPESAAGDRAHRQQTGARAIAPGAARQRDKPDWEDQVTMAGSMVSSCEPALNMLSRRALLRGVGALAFGPPLDAGFRARRPAQTQPTLTEIVWQWQATVAPDGTIRWQPDQPDRYTVTFGADGTLAIQADCNRARGVYSLDGATIALRIGSSTRMRCAADSLMEQFLGGLEYAAAWLLQPGELALTLTGGEEMRFAPADEAGTPSPAAG